MNLPQPQLDYLPFDGGLDTETSPMSVPGGRLRAAQNYEIGIQGGYQDIAGYERFDGRPAPSDATYSLLNVTISGEFSVGDTVTQLVSTATGYVLAVVTTDTPNYLVLSKITGTFDATNDLQVSASTEGTSLSAAMAGAAQTPELHATYTNLAADAYRADIAVMPGSGSILGVWCLNGTWYGVRNNVGATAAVIHKETTSGWAAVALGRELSFTSGGTYEIAEGDTITGATSGCTAVITRVVLTGGTWAAGDAAGKLIFATQSTTFQSENLNVGASTNVATIAGNSSAITLLPGGRFETVNHNFAGAGGSLRTYGCDGVNRSWEFDGTVFVPIDTGMTTDNPSHLIVFKNHLFLSFGSSAQHSSLSLPYEWSPLTGAAELNIGEPITGYVIEPGDGANAALGVYGRNRINILYGTSSADWQLFPYREEVGAYAHTLQQVGQTLFLDDRGVSNLRTAQEFGNFNSSTLSTHIQRWLNARKGLASASCLVREKNQYRIFFSNDSALYVTLDGPKIRGMMPIQFNHTVTCCQSVELADGTEEILFGSDDGYVYQLDRGTSFDGASIEAYITLHFHASKMMRVIKKYLSAVLEARGPGYAEFSVRHEISYADVNKPQAGAASGAVSFSGAVWDTGAWDTGYWDGVTLGPSRYKLHGSGENISLSISKSSDKYTPVTFSGVLLRFTTRRVMR